MALAVEQPCRICVRWLKPLIDEGVYLMNSTKAPSSPNSFTPGLPWGNQVSVFGFLTAVGTLPGGWAAASEEGNLTKQQSGTWVDLRCGV
jgi:hypothetical protein